MVTLNGLVRVFRMRSWRVVAACSVSGVLVAGASVLGYSVWTNAAVPSINLVQVWRPRIRDFSLISTTISSDLT